MVALKTLQLQSDTPTEDIKTTKMNSQKSTLSFASFLEFIDSKEIPTEQKNAPLNNNTSLLKTEETKDTIKLLQELLGQEHSQEVSSKTPLSTKETTLQQLLQEENSSNPPFELNKDISKQLSPTELKVLIKEAKSYLQQKISQNQDLTTQIDPKKLPKNLKSLLDIAEKLKIDISKISVEEISTNKEQSKVQESPLQTFKPKQTPLQEEIQTPKETSSNKEKTLLQKTNTTTELKELLSPPQKQKTQSKQTPLQEEVHTPKETPSNKEKTLLQKTNTTTELKELLSPPQKQKVQPKQTPLQEEVHTPKETPSKENKTLQTIATKIDPLQTTPLFQKQLKQTTLTTKEFIDTKTKKTPSFTTKQTDLLHSLLQTPQTSTQEQKSTSLFNSLFGTLTQQNSQKNTTVNTLKQETQRPLQSLNSLESLLQPQTQENIQIQTPKADSFEVKVQEAKQMMRYLSEDIKKSIDDYKPPFTRVKVQLNPQKLGDIDLTVVQRGNNVHVNLSSNNAALNILSNNLHELKTQLAESGINNASFNFNSSSQQNGQQQNKHTNYEYFAHEEDEEIQNSLEIIIPHYV